MLQKNTRALITLWMSFSITYTLMVKKKCQEKHAIETRTSVLHFTLYCISVNFRWSWTPMDLWFSISCLSLSLKNKMYPDFERSIFLLVLNASDEFLNKQWHSEWSDLSKLIVRWCICITPRVWRLAKMDRSLI